MDAIDRPGSVTVFMWLWGLVIALSILSFLSAAGDAEGTAVAVGIVSNVIQILLVVLAARRRNWARWVLAILFVIGLFYFLTQVGAVFAYSQFLGFLNVASYIAGGIGIFFVFTSEASDWYRSREIPEVPPHVAAARRRKMTYGASAVGIAAVLGAGYAIWNPDFTDWEPIRALCFDETAPPRDSIDACSEMVDSGRFEGPELAAIYLRQGDLYIATDRPVLATGSYREASRAEPDNLEAWRKYAQARLDGGYSSLAIVPLQRALELAPDDIDLRTMLGRAMFEAERYEEALPELEAAVEHQPGSAELQAYLAATRNRLGAYEAALEAIGNALALEPDNAAYAVVHADALFYSERYDEALERYQHVIELVPGAADALIGVASVRCATSEIDTARAIIDQMMADEQIREINLQALMAVNGFMAEPSADLTNAAMWSSTIGPETDAALTAWMAQGCPLPPPVTDG